MPVLVTLIEFQGNSDIRKKLIICEGMFNLFESLLSIKLKLMWLLYMYVYTLTLGNEIVL